LAPSLALELVVDLEGALGDQEESAADEDDRRPVTANPST
jgi:hypothetical protein